jgi:hypothetical protein
VFGDIGRVDYVRGDGQIVTRLGHSVPQNPVNPPVAFRVSTATATTLTDSSASFPVDALAGFQVQLVAADGQAQLGVVVSNTATTLTFATPWATIPDATFSFRILFQAANVQIAGENRATLTDPLGNFALDYGGLVGLEMQAISPDGHVQFRQIIANTATTLTLDRPWDPLPLVDPAEPKRIFFYRVSAVPEFQTDGILRGARVAWTIDGRAVGFADRSECADRT